ncbi:MAG: bis(5'-nucleosyl)-tetraphosphatase (symmetrical) YqeK, partial [Elusimicrobiota bacterium]|nr:bis(5'-nucleosyl)-tetraphosphatase (symmetrical) YqeK [Elusimicrobiota bacterium]
MDMEKIYKFLSENLDKERFEHTLNVAKLSARLAKIHGESVEKARLAGLLHDCSKNKDYKRQIDFFKDRKQFKGFSDLAKYAPFALHSFSSAIIAEEVFLIKDKEILDAIKNHTFASVKMTALSKILFVSDSSSLDRKGKQAPLIR